MSSHPCPGYVGGCRKASPDKNASRREDDGIVNSNVSSIRMFVRHSRCCTCTTARRYETAAGWSIKVGLLLRPLCRRGSRDDTQNRGKELSKKEDRTRNLVVRTHRVYAAYWKSSRSSSRTAGQAKRDSRVGTDTLRTFRKARTAAPPSPATAPPPTPARSPIGDGTR